jgi:hypothetical protein
MMSRIVTLSIATVLFVTIWNSQDGSSRRLPSRGGQPRPAALEEIRALFDSPTKPELPEFSQLLAGRLEALEAIPSIAAARTLAPLPSPVMTDAVPLPTEIAPGKYCVVSNDGQTGLILVTEADLPERDAAQRVRRDSYTHHEGARRWFFLRLDAAEIEASEISDAPLEPEFEESIPKKYDFSGYADRSLTGAADSATK